jgi:hypothetical protein
MRNDIAASAAVSPARFVLDRAANLAVRVWVVAIVVFGTAIFTGIGVLQSVRQIPLWLWVLVAVVLAQPLIQARSWKRAAAATRGVMRWKGRVGILLVFEAANYALLYLLGVALGGEAEYQAHMNAYVEFMMSAGASFLSFLAAFYCACTLRFPLVDRLASMVTRPPVKVPSRRQPADDQVADNQVGARQPGAREVDVR